MTIRRTLLALGLGVAVMLPTTASSCDPGPTSQVEQQEQEDCDADDLIEGDEDCYGVDLTDKKTKKTIKPATKPNKGPTTSKRNR